MPARLVSETLQSEAVRVRLDPASIRGLRAIADRQGLSMSDVIRAALQREADAELARLRRKQ